MQSNGEEHRAIPFGLYVKVWAGLIVLTAVTVGASYAELPNVAILTALMIAVTKATLVLLYFMHLRFERRLFFFMLLVALVTYAVFIVLTFSDYSFRDAQSRGDAGPPPLACSQDPGDRP